MGQPLVIREATTQEVDQLGWGTFLHREALRRISRYPDEILFFAWAGEEIVGHLACHPAIPTHFWCVEVSPTHRREGIGCYLMETAEGQLRQRGIQEVELAVEIDNKPAIAFYEKLGYSCFGTVDAAWQELDDEGNVVLYKCLCFKMKKFL